MTVTAPDPLRYCIDRTTDIIPDTYWSAYNALPEGAQMIPALIFAWGPTISLIPLIPLFAPTGTAPLFAVQMMIEFQSLIGVTDPILVFTAYQPILMVVTFVSLCLVFSHLEQTGAADY